MLRGSISSVGIIEIGGAKDVKLIVILSYKLEVLSKSIKSPLSNTSPKIILDIISTSTLFLYYILLLFLTIETLSSSHSGVSKLIIITLAYYSTSSRRKAGGIEVETTKISNYSSLTIVAGSATRGLKNTLL